MEVERNGRRREGMERVMGGSRSGQKGEKEEDWRKSTHPSFYPSLGKLSRLLFH
jgi:hypothetical protein